MDCDHITDKPLLFNFKMFYSCTWKKLHDPLCCFQDSTWGLTDWQSTENGIAAAGVNHLLNDGSWAIVGDSFSESYVGKWIQPKRKRQNKKYNESAKRNHNVLLSIPPNVLCCISSSVVACYSKILSLNCNILSLKPAGHVSLLFSCHISTVHSLIKEKCAPESIQRICLSRPCILVSVSYFTVGYLHQIL